MSDSKLKTTVEILPLRDSMENRPAQRLDQSFLVDGYAIGRYSGTGDTIICELSERPNQRLLENSSPVICYTQCGFDIISIHQNEVLQVMDVKSKKSELFKQARILCRPFAASLLTISTSLLSPRSDSSSGTAATSTSLLVKLTHPALPLPSQPFLTEAQ